VCDKAFDLLSLRFAKGLGPTEINGVSLHQVGIELMLADKLAEAVSESRATVISVYWLGWYHWAEDILGPEVEPSSSTEHIPIPYAFRSARLTARVSVTRISAPWTKGKTLDASVHTFVAATAAVNTQVGARPNGHHVLNDSSEPWR
jgi:hypothetical protein